MFVRNYLNKIVSIDQDAYSSEKQFYIDLWKIKFNIDISKNIKEFNIIDYL